PAALLRAVPALRGDAVAEVRAPALGERTPGDGGVSLLRLRAGDRGAPQDGDARRRRVAGDSGGRGPFDGRLPPVGALFAGRLAELGPDRPRLGGGPGVGRSDQ